MPLWLNHDIFSRNVYLSSSSKLKALRLPTSFHALKHRSLICFPAFFFLLHVSSAPQNAYDTPYTRPKERYTPANAIGHSCRNLMYNSNNGKRDRENDRWYRPEQTLVQHHLPEPTTGLISRRQRLPIWASRTCIHRYDVFDEVICPRKNRFPFGCRADAKRCLPRYNVEKC